jgi:hypothetical protein
MATARRTTARQLRRLHRLLDQLLTLTGGKGREWRRVMRLIRCPR